jgi:hypothetical protein
MRLADALALAQQTYGEDPDEAGWALSWAARAALPVVGGVPLYLVGKYSHRWLSRDVERRKLAESAARGDTGTYDRMVEQVLHEARTLADIDVMRVLSQVRRRWCGGAQAMRPDVSDRVTGLIDEARGRGGRSATLVSEARVAARRRAESSQQAPWAAYLVGEAAGAAAAAALLCTEVGEKDREFFQRPWRAIKGADYTGVYDDRSARQARRLNPFD